MLEIWDGRKEFYQWDTNRKIIVTDETVTEVHFCNKTDDCSLVVEVKNGLADVPNILLQTDWPIHVYAYCGDCYTKESATFKVNKRTKPADYVYTETEIMRWETLEQRMEELESSIGEEIEKALDEYFEENPVDVDLSGYATKKELEGKQNRLENFSDRENPIIWSNDSRYYFYPYALGYAASDSGAEQFSISAKNGLIDKTLSFNFYEDNLTYSHYDYELNERNTKTIAFVEDVEAKLGDIDTALDELHAYAQALTNGGGAE